MKITKSNSGLTLIEIIITIGILSFVTLLLLSIFANGYFHIKNAGDDTVVLYDSQTDLEYVIATKITDASDTGIDFIFDENPIPVHVDGAEIIEDNLVSFIPGNLTEIPAASLLSITLDTILVDVWDPTFNSLIYDYTVTIIGETGSTPPSIDTDYDKYTELANVSITTVATNYTNKNETVITVEYDGDEITYTLTFEKNWY